MQSMLLHRTCYQCTWTALLSSVPTWQGLTHSGSAGSVNRPICTDHQNTSTVWAPAASVDKQAFIGSVIKAMTCLSQNPGRAQHLQNCACKLVQAESMTMTHKIERLLTTWTHKTWTNFESLSMKSIQGVPSALHDDCTAAASRCTVDSSAS